MARTRSIADPPLPNWPILMGTRLAARYLSLDEHSFAVLTQRAGVRPVDLGISMVRWRRSELDRLVGALPSAIIAPRVDPPAEDPGHAEHVARRIAEEVASRLATRDAQPTAVRAAEVLSIKDAAQAIGVGRSTIYKLIGEGRLATRRIGRRRLVRRADLQALLSET